MDLLGIEDVVTHGEFDRKIISLLMFEGLSVIDVQLALCFTL